jgi:hypothetical protein
MIKNSAYCFTATTENGSYRSIISAFDKADALYKAFHELAASFYKFEIKKKDGD